jgi:P27 family predicted phage terminase small subunit
LKLLRGNPGRRPLNRNEPQPAIPATVPEPPPCVTVGYALDEWRRVAPELLAMGLLTVVDIAPLGAYCCAYGRWCEAEEALARMREKDPIMFGLTIENGEGAPVTNPLVRIARNARLDMVRLASEFGFTPSARTRIDVGQAGEYTQSKFGKLIA